MPVSSLQNLDGGYLALELSASHIPGYVSQCIFVQGTNLRLMELQNLLPPGSSLVVCMLSCWVASHSLRPNGLVHRAPLSMELSRQEYWSGLPFPTPGAVPDPGIEPLSPSSPVVAGEFFTTAPPGKASLLSLPANYQLMVSTTSTSAASTSPLSKMNISRLLHTKNSTYFIFIVLTNPLLGSPTWQFSLLISLSFSFFIWN